LDDEAVEMIDDPLSLSTVIAKGGRDAAGPGTGALRQARASLFCCCIAVCSSPKIDWKMKK